MTRHQAAHPGEWTPVLIETTAAWSAVVRALSQDQQEALAMLNGASTQPPSFVRRCAVDPTLRAQLDLLCERQLHGLLMAWIIDALKTQLHAHAAPHFWVRYHETSASGGRAGAAHQRRCQANFFAAVRSLHGYVGTRLQLVRVLEDRLWGDAAWSERAWNEAPWSEALWHDRAWRRPASAGSPMNISSAPSPVPSSAKSPTPMESDSPRAEAEVVDGDGGGGFACSELLTSLQALVLAFAPDGLSFDSWVRVSWERSFIDLCKVGTGSSRLWGMGHGC